MFGAKISRRPSRKVCEPNTGKELPMAISSEKTAAAASRQRLARFHWLSTSSNSAAVAMAKAGAMGAISRTSRFSESAKKISPPCCPHGDPARSGSHLNGGNGIAQQDEYVIHSHAQGRLSFCGMHRYKIAFLKGTMSDGIPVVDIPGSCQQNSRSHDQDGCHRRCKRPGRSGRRFRAPGPLRSPENYSHNGSYEQRKGDLHQQPQPAQNTQTERPSLASGSFPSCQREQRANYQRRQPVLDQKQAGKAEQQGREEREEHSQQRHSFAEELASEEIKGRRQRQAGRAVDEVNDENRPANQTKERERKHGNQRCFVSQGMLEAAPVAGQPLRGESIEQTNRRRQVPTIVPMRGALLANAPTEDYRHGGGCDQVKAEGESLPTGGSAHQKNLNFRAAKTHMRNSSRPCRKRLMLVEP